MGFIEKYKDTNVYMVSGLDSLGVPYTPDNVEHKAFVDLVAEEFRKNGIHINYVNLSSLAYNKTWELKQILDKDYTEEQYTKLNKRLNKMVLDKSQSLRRMSKFPKIGFTFPSHEKFIDEYYSVSSNSTRHITESLKNVDNPIFLYSCGGMNVDYYCKLYTNDIKQIIPEVTLRFAKNIKQTIIDVKDCINYIANLNPNIEVYVIGSYPIVENRELRFILQPFYIAYNEALKRICSKYDNVCYVDIFNTKQYIAPNDCHPTYEGQKYMAGQIIAAMNKK